MKTTYYYLLINHPEYEIFKEYTDAIKAGQSSYNKYQYLIHISYKVKVKISKQDKPEWFLNWLIENRPHIFIPKEKIRTPNPPPSKPNVEHETVFRSGKWITKVKATRLNI